MTKPFIFVSCGQYTEAEKALGSAIVEMVRKLTGLGAYFAQEVQDLNGLDSNILAALHECAAFVTVRHPRGTILRPDGSEQVRASVWIEQEIAIATYIQRVEKRPLPVIAFIHESVGREGLRDLLQLNPISFSDNSEVLAALPTRLMEWKGLTATGIRVQLESVGGVIREGHCIRQLVASLVNDSSQRIIKLDCVIRLPAGILKHWSALYPYEDKSDKSADSCYRSFRVNESHTGPIQPHSTGRLLTFDYCTQCAFRDAGGIAALAGGAPVTATVWIDGRE